MTMTTRQARRFALLALHGAWLAALLATGDALAQTVPSGGTRPAGTTAVPGAPGVSVPVTARPTPTAVTVAPITSPATAPVTAPPSATAPTGGPERIEVRQADRVDYDGGTKLVVLTGAVHIVRGTLSLKADRIEIALGDDEKSVRTATATGRVEVIDGTRRAIAERAVYTENTSDLLLTGSPRLWDGGNEIEADRILYNLNTRAMRAEGHVRGLFLPGGFAPR